MAKSKAKILVVDDNNGIRAALGLLLPMHFAQVELIPSPKELVSRLADFRPDVVLLDMNFHTDINTGNEGLFWLSEIKKRCEDVEVVLFTAYADIQLAVEGMKRGAFDFIVKPWDNEKLIEILKAAYANRSKEARNVVITAQLTPSEQTVISISNDGLPITRESQDEIFVPFFTTKQEGTGIGLSLSRQIMRLHNGSLKLTKSDAQSTVFTLIFR